MNPGFLEAIAACLSLMFLYSVQDEHSMAEVTKGQGKGQ